MTWLVVGGDGLIGRRVAVDARSIAGSVVTSSRRPGPHSGQVFADLATGNVSAVTAVGAEVVFLCAAMTNMQACLDSPELTYRVNVTETVKLASQLVKQGAFVVFLSSNTVFNGLVSMPDEDEPAEPVTEYGLQKSITERQLLSLPGASEQIAIVRLSKVLSASLGMAAEFLRRFRAGETCPAFDDLRISPVSLSYVTNGLLEIASGKLSGLFHLSGADELSYADFARRLAKHVASDPELVKAVPARSALANVLFNPRYPALGMKRTQIRLGIAPEPLCGVLKDLSGNLP